MDIVIEARDIVLVLVFWIAPRWLVRAQKGSEE
jgi:hypothetical protein